MLVKDIPDELSGVYKITFQNGKSYIGISNNIKRRMKEHNCEKKEYPICNAIKKYGKITEIEILEEIPSDQRELMYEREKYYIQKYQSLITQNGYNVSEGGPGFSHGDYVKKGKPAPPDYVEEIILQLQEDKKTFEEIAEEFNLCLSTITAINNGYTYWKDGIDYPIRKKRLSTSRTLTRDQILDIINILKETNIYMKDIAKEKGISEYIIEDINNGKRCYYIEGVKYPVRYKNSNRKKFSEEQISQIINDLRNSTLTQIEIGKKYGCGRQLIGQINRGEKYKQNDIKYPIR